MKPLFALHGPYSTDDFPGFDDDGYVHNIVEYSALRRIWRGLGGYQWIHSTNWTTSNNCKCLSKGTKRTSIVQAPYTHELLVGA